MLFFQALLLAGYAYAHLVTRWLNQRAQAIVHLVVVCLPLMVLPLSIPADWTPPTQQNPVYWLLMLLTVSIGGPFFALSATTPLMQRWFAATSHRSASDPYFLYAASNLGSMTALFAYPFLIEPNLGLDRQSEFWSIGYAVLAIGLAACAIAALRTGASAITTVPVAPPSESNDPEAPSARVPTNRLRLEWLALSFIPSSWMLGVTTALTTDFVPIPLLWILPLALYLLTFILAFAQRFRPPHNVVRRMLLPTVLILALTTLFRGSLALVIVHLAGLFIAGLVCHGELVRRRPRAENLTEFYLWLSVGGMLGGLLNAVIAPLLFSYVFEYPLTIVAAGLLFGWFDRSEQRSNSRLVRTAATGVFVLAVAALYGEESIWSLVQLDIVLVCLPIALFCYWLNRPMLFTLAAGVPLVAFALKLLPDKQVVHRGRSFFGVHQVVRDEHDNFTLKHGTTLHGRQSRRLGGECQPRAYYHQSGPLGDVFLTLGATRADRPIAYVGLGAGAAICYQRPGQKAVIYEIDPVVVEIAENPEYFTYLSNCSSGPYEIVIGDGRMQLSKANDHSYGMIVLDAFSSDAVPTHLLTREAMRLYLQKLDDNGILVLHISNLSRSDLANISTKPHTSYPSTHVFKDENDMAGYRQHISFSGLLGIGYGAAAVYLCGFKPVQGILAGVLTWIAGMLPDLDSETGKPVREVFGLLAAVAPLTMMGHLQRWGGNPEAAMMLAVLVYAAVRYGGAFIVGKLSVHRGMFHSIPALLIAAELAYLAYQSDSMAVKLLMAGGVGVGFLSHLVLDEIYAVEWTGIRIRLNKAAGSAIKLVGKSFLPNVVTYALLCVLTYATLVDLGLLEDPTKDGSTPAPVQRQAAEEGPTLR
eukprot:g21901.t1